MAERIESKRIVRTCPRCRRRLHHRASLCVDGKRFTVEASCSDCGHQFEPRLIKDEWDHFAEESNG